VLSNCNKTGFIALQVQASRTLKRLRNPVLLLNRAY